MERDVQARWDPKLVAVSVFYTYCVVQAIDRTVQVFKDSACYASANEASKLSETSADSDKVQCTFLAWTWPEFSAALVLLAYLTWLALHFYRGLFRYFPESNPKGKDNYRDEVWKTIGSHKHRFFGFIHLAVTLGLFYVLAAHLGPPDQTLGIIVLLLVLWDLALIIPLSPNGSYFTRDRLGAFVGEFYGDVIGATYSDDISDSNTVARKGIQAKMHLFGHFYPEWYTKDTSNSESNWNFKAFRNFFGNLKLIPASEQAPRSFTGRFHGLRLEDGKAAQIEGEHINIFMSGVFNGVVYRRSSLKPWLVFPWRKQNESVGWWWCKLLCEAAFVFAFLDFRHEIDDLFWAAAALVAVLVGAVGHQWTKNCFDIGFSEYPKLNTSEIDKGTEILPRVSQRDFASGTIAVIVWAAVISILIYVYWTRLR